MLYYIQVFWLIEIIYNEMIVHVPMAVHQNIRKVLVIGAGDGGVVKELQNARREDGESKEKNGHKERARGEVDLFLCL